ncbi:Hypothetical predicted protein [Pelobates cultripes]|uniref:Uncharacterized protein n=1 Tax=Pelobates cultripes TaxID=61616 RepID=A0AAD1S1U7_PELCU|nr:Hypothetical predicted protein [Pelobates cultripes]
MLDLISMVPVPAYSKEGGGAAPRHKQHNTNSPDPADKPSDRLRRTAHNAQHCASSQNGPTAPPRQHLLAAPQQDGTKQLDGIGRGALYTKGGLLNLQGVDTEHQRLSTPPSATLSM